MTEANTKPGDFVWYDLLTTDPKAAPSFYEYVIGWKSHPMEGSSGYTLFENGMSPVGGVSELTERARQMGAPPHWMSNVQVTDVNATVAIAKPPPPEGGGFLSAPEGA